MDMEVSQAEQFVVPLKYNDEGKRPVIEIAYRNGRWWPLPQVMSEGLYDKYVQDEINIGYTWDWGKTGLGSWSPNGEETSINRYILDFTCMEQTNIDNNRKRSFRIVWVLPEQIEAIWTGEIPEQGEATWIDETHS